MCDIEHLHRTIHPNKQLYFKTSEIVRVALFRCSFLLHTSQSQWALRRDKTQIKLISRHLRSTCLITETNNI